VLQDELDRLLAMGRLSDHREALLSFEKEGQRLPEERFRLQELTSTNQKVSQVAERSRHDVVPVAAELTFDRQNLPHQRLRLRVGALPDVHHRHVVQAL